VTAAVTAAGAPVRRVVEYHDGTKHHFNRFARSLGYLDWASQPNPFRSYHGAREVPLFPRPDALALDRPPSPTYDALFDTARGLTREPALPISPPAIGYFLRHALGLSAWKRAGGSRWSLRVNPSSGNLHPTEAYVLAETTVWHYAPDRHALEERCVFSAAAWEALPVDPARSFLVGLTSIHWREAWKYGERAFRYCHHDIGHALAALRFSAAVCGWHAALLSDWPHGAVAASLGVNRAEDFQDAEPEDPACVLLVTMAEAAGRSGGAFDGRRGAAFARIVSEGRWTGRASQLSEDHVQWAFIDDVAAATSESATGDIGDVGDAGDEPHEGQRPVGERPEGERSAREVSGPLVVARPDRGWPAAALLLQRRSAVALDGMSWLERDAFLAMLTRTLPGSHPPFDMFAWQPRLHLVLFVHRVRDVAPGVYLLVRCGSSVPWLRSALGPDLEWEVADPHLPLWRLRAGECRALAQRLSCDQAIAADGCFSLGMLAEFEGSLDRQGAACYRQLFWEAGAIGQVLYLEAEAAGARGTGIGCFYDDAVHEVLGVRDHTVQSLYHFTVGSPVEDARITSEGGYPWPDPAAG
jgi:SagB-type dehydrogenase family enzyme